MWDALGEAGRGRGTGEVAGRKPEGAGGGGMEGSFGRTSSRVRYFRNCAEGGALKQKFHLGGLEELRIAKGTVRVRESAHMPRAPPHGRRRSLRAHISQLETAERYHESERASETS